jgi:6-phosphogluconolactonase
MEGIGMKNNIIQSIIFDIKKEIAKKGKASLFVSGGSTPVALFKKLSKTNLAWEKVTISLCDERCVNPKDKNSNANLVKKYLLQHYAKKAKFIPLYLPKMQINHMVKKQANILKSLQPFDMVILGMGDDGHTASLFPNNKKLKEAYAKNNKSILITILPDTAPFKRISLTKNAILSAKNIYLHTKGEKKQNLYNQIIKCNDTYQYPILSILQSDKKIKVFNE